MSLYIPSQSEIAEVSQSRGADSEAPDLWRGLVGWWPMQEGGGATAFDASGWGNHGTLTGMDPATDRVVGPIGRALDFDGTNDYVVTPSLTQFSGATEYTFSCWLWFTGERTIDVIVEHSTNFNSNRGSFLLYLDSNNLYVGRRAEGWNVVYLPEPSEGVWNHITVTFANVGTGGQSPRVYYNGRLQAITSLTHDAATTTAAGSQPLYLASRVSENLWLACKMSNVVLHRRLLAPSEIAQLYADPWAMGTLRRRVFPAAAAAGEMPTGAADLAAIASVTAAGRVAAKGSAALSAVASTSAIGYASHSGSGDLSAVAALSAAGYVVSSGSADLGATGSLDATGYAAASGSAALAGVGALEAAGYRVSEGSAELIAVGTFSAAGTVEEVGGGAIIPSLGGRFFRRGGKPQFLGAMAYRR
jgi:hypothetical protein